MELRIDKKCEMCGAQLEISADGLKAVCPYCGTAYSYVKPITEDTATYINRANNYRMRNMFDNAIVEYKTLLMNAELKDNAELYWGLLLSEYGIEYVHDAREDRYVPTCHRTVSGSIFDNANYKKATELATEGMRAEYSARAAEIEELQSAIKAQAEQTEGYEVFICFKSTDNRAATEDRYIARRIYDETTKRGFRTFFSEVSLKGKLGSEYEPVIYKALTTAKVMIIVATKEEYLNAPFVRNEWSRYIERKKDDPSLKVVPVFRDIATSALPVREQGIDLSKYPAGGYEIDIADNLERLLGKPTEIKADKEVLEEYSRYNAINGIKFEKEYKNAMREVDVSIRRRKDAGKEYTEKAAAMEALGDYKNAQALARQYNEQAEFYTKAENKCTFKMRLLHFVCSVISAVFAVYAIILMGAIAGGGYDSTIFPELGTPDVMIFELSCILTGIAVGIMLAISLVCLIGIKRFKFQKYFMFIEFSFYALSIVMIIIVMIAYSGDGEDIAASRACYTPILLEMLCMFAASIIKYIFFKRLPEYKTI